MTHADIPIWVRTPDGLAFSDVPVRSGGKMPDFCIIGSPKCGTTTLDRYLGAHPGVFVCELKEPHYFSTPEILARGEAWYTGLYAGAAPEQICGEASTSYTRYPIVPGTVERMYDANPDMKLIYILRNPVDRVESEALQTMKYLKNVMGEDFRHMTLDAFLEMIEDPASPYYSAIVETSRYEEQIRAFEARFPPEQILLLTQADLRQEPEAVMQRLHAFLGLAAHTEFAGGGDKNVTADFFTGSAREAATGRLSRLPGYGVLKALVPEAMKKRLIKSLSGPPNPQAQKLSLDMRQRLEHELAASTAAVAARIGQPANTW